MPSRTIRPTAAPTAAPFAYMVGGVETLAPEAISASWDGTGAGSDFLPAVSFYSPTGVLIARAFPDQPVAAGDAAEVSYYPFRRGSAAVAPPPVAALVTTDGVATVNPTNELDIGDGLALTNPGAGIAALAVAPAYAYAILRIDPPFVDGHKFTITSRYASGITIGADTLTLNTAGLYLLSSSFSFQLNGAAAATSGAGYWMFNETSNQQVTNTVLGFEPQSFTAVNTWGDCVAAVAIIRIATGGTRDGNPGDVFSFRGGRLAASGGSIANCFGSFSLVRIHA